MNICTDSQYNSSRLNVVFYYLPNTFSLLYILFECQQNDFYYSGKRDLLPLKKVKFIWKMEENWSGNQFFSISYIKNDGCHDVKLICNGNLPGYPETKVTLPFLQIRVLLLSRNFLIPCMESLRVHKRWCRKELFMKQ